MRKLAERWNDLPKAAQQVVKQSLKPDFLNPEPMPLTTLILPMRNVQTSQIITSPHCQNSHYLLNGHKYFKMPYFYNQRISRQTHYVLKSHTCWYPWRSVSCSCISFWICFNFSSVTGSAVSPKCNHLCFLFDSSKPLNFENMQVLFYLEKEMIQWAVRENNRKFEVYKPKTAL